MELPIYNSGLSHAFTFSTCAESSNTDSIAVVRGRGNTIFKQDIGVSRSYRTSGVGLQTPELRPAIQQGHGRLAEAGFLVCRWFRSSDGKASCGPGRGLLDRARMWRPVQSHTVFTWSRGQDKFPESESDPWLASVGSVA